MNAKKYDYDEFIERTPIVYGIIYWLGQDNEEGYWRFITEIDFDHKVYGAKKGEMAYTFPTLKSAQNFNLNVMRSGRRGFVVELFDGFRPINYK